MTAPAPPEPRTVTVTFAGDVDPRLTPNTRVSMRTQLRVRRTRKDDARYEIRAVRPDPIHGPVILTYTRYQAPNRKPMDRDNLIAATKCLVDALVAEGVIDGDGPQIVREIRVAEQVAAMYHAGVDGEIAVTITPAGGQE